MSILLTGGTGFIGSHTAVELLSAGQELVIADNLSNSSADVVRKIEHISGKTFRFYKLDVADSAALRQMFAENHIDTVVHFAGFKAVGESVQNPIKYYRNNLDSTLTLLETMREFSCNRFVFSSSATVYGMSNVSPLGESQQIGGITNPYGWTKYMIEQILRDTAKAAPQMSVVLLRYFNPIGAHESGLIGEKPNGIPNNLMPYITQVAAGILDKVSIFGNDYPTPDGTGIRDYIHVVDLAKGHIAAVKYSLEHTGVEVFNLGTGVGCSVLELLHAFEAANHISIPYAIAPRRPGDVAACYADARKAGRLLGWRAEKSIEEMCRDSWKWQRHCLDNSAWDA